jgi:hypothetical protein
MLKSFDRAFWLRHYKFPDDIRWKPHKAETADEDNDIVLELACRTLFIFSVLTCTAFDDPESTFSVRFLKS